MKGITEKKDSDLQKLLAEKRKELRLFRFSKAGAKVKNTKEKRDLNKEIARILTELNRRKNEVV